MAALVTHPGGQSAFALSQIAQLKVENTFVAQFHPEIPHMTLAVAYSNRSTRYVQPDLRPTRNVSCID